MKKILVINGPNLGRLGVREPGVYGKSTLSDLEELIRKEASGLGLGVEFFQSDVEGELGTKINTATGKADGIILNPAAYTHTSIALRDAIQSVSVPRVEVHISNTSARDGFRHTSFTAAACIGQIIGFGFDSYLLALQAFARYFDS
ncbi:MAG: type II 3-dehydroquinate dehydratase [Lentisphaerae bacterium]|nr:type II 3-dehydroquinate dehydratase [Lentisphaerota bacterium]